MALPQLHSIPVFMHTQQTGRICVTYLQLVEGVFYYSGMYGYPFNFVCSLFYHISCIGLNDLLPHEIQRLILVQHGT